MKKGFSLIELLISLIVISLIAASFTPIITSKLKHREISHSAAKPMKIDCSPFDSVEGNCLLCDEKQCSICTSSFNIPDGYYINPNVSCNKKPCSDFDSNCKRCTKDNCQECKSGYIFNLVTKKCNQVKCSKGFYVYNSSCKRCDENTIQPNDNSIATSCINCNNNEISNTERTICSIKTCPQGYYPNDRTCHSCSNFSPYCTSCTSALCISCKPGYHVSGSGCAQNEVSCSGNTYRDISTNTCKTCIDNCASCNDATSCSVCNKGYEFSNGKCTKSCPNWAVKIILNGKNYCFTKLNIGDDSTVNVLMGFYPVLSRDGFNYKDGHCWKHDHTAGTNSMPQPNPEFSYNPQGRTVCTWGAAKYLCSRLKEADGKNWQLPSAEIMYLLQTKINNENKNCSTSPIIGNFQKCAGANGLQLCDGGNNYSGSPHCSIISDACIKSGDDYCMPHTIWDINGKRFPLNNGKFGGPAENTENYAHSVRCVLQL